LRVKPTARQSIPSPWSYLLCLFSQFIFLKTHENISLMPISFMTLTGLFSYHMIFFFFLITWFLQRSEWQLLLFHFFFPSNLKSDWICILKCVLENNYFLFEVNIFLVFLIYFDVLILKINLKKQKKYYFNIFLSTTIPPLIMLLTHIRMSKNHLNLKT